MFFFLFFFFLSIIAPIIECITPKSSLDERLNKTVVEGTVLTYQCDSGLSLTGPTTIICGNDGQWSTNLATLTCVTPVTPGELAILFYAVNHLFEIH